MTAINSSVIAIDDCISDVKVCTINLKIKTICTESCYYKMQCNQDQSVEKNNKILNFVNEVLLILKCLLYICLCIDQA